MIAVNKTLAFLNENWTNIIVMVGLALLLIEKFKRYSRLSKEEKINKALVIVRETLLSKMSEAEIGWQEYKKSGKLKKSQVIQEIYEEFPILTEYYSQESLIAKIEAMIDSEMENLNEIINKELKEEA